MYEIREAREEDREQTVDMLVRVFKEIESFEEVWVESWKNYMNKPEHEDWDYIATHNGDVVANLAFFANSCLRYRRGTLSVNLCAATSQLRLVLGWFMYGTIVVLKSQLRLFGATIT